MLRPTEVPSPEPAVQTACPDLRFLFSPPAQLTEGAKSEILKEYVERKANKRLNAVQERRLDMTRALYLLEPSSLDARSTDLTPRHYRYMQMSNGRASLGGIKSSLGSLKNAATRLWVRDFKAPLRARINGRITELLETPTQRQDHQRLERTNIKRQETPHLHERTHDRPEQHDIFQRTYTIETEEHENGRELFIVSKVGRNQVGLSLRQETGEMEIISAYRVHKDLLPVSDVFYEHYRYAMDQGFSMPPIERIIIRHVMEENTRPVRVRYGNGTFQPGSQAFQELLQTPFGKTVCYFQRDYPHLLAGKELASITVSERNTLTFAFPKRIHMGLESNEERTAPAENPEALLVSSVNSLDQQGSPGRSSKEPDGEASSSTRLREGMPIPQAPSGEESSPEVLSGPERSGIHAEGASQAYPPLHERTRDRPEQRQLFRQMYTTSTEMNDYGVITFFRAIFPAKAPSGQKQIESFPLSGRRSLSIL